MREDVQDGYHIEYMDSETLNRHYFTGDDQTVTTIDDALDQAYWFEWCPSPSEFYCVDDTGTLLLPDLEPDMTCEKTEMHKCECPDGLEYDIIIDGDSIKLGPKYFSNLEIEQL